MEIKRIIKEYYEQLYVHKFDNFNEIDLLKDNLPTLTLKKKSLTTSIKEIEFITNLAQQKATGPGGYTNKFYQIFKFSSVQSFRHIRLLATP